MLKQAGLKKKTEQFCINKNKAILNTVYCCDTSAVLEKYILVHENQSVLW
jgi:hypothetical protein